MLEYIAQRPDHLFSEPPKTEEPYSTPRSWHMLSDALREWGGISEEEIRLLAYGSISPTHARMFVAFTKQAENKRFLADIIKGNERWPEAPEDRDVQYCRVVFRDAEATDAGYLSPDDLSGKVRVTGRGGTVLQPGIDCLEKVPDFPEKGPILIITDGFIENNLRVRRDHAFILAPGGHLPFKARGDVFRMNK